MLIDGREETMVPEALKSFSLKEPQKMVSLIILMLKVPLKMININLNRLAEGLNEQNLNRILDTLAILIKDGHQILADLIH
jgi:hypothetical protein